MSNFKFYFDFLSPLSRPFWILFEHANIQCERIPVALRKGEHLSEEFGKDVNRFHKLPAINDNGFKLAESVAIFHYLGRKQIIPERWYPSNDLKALARIDEYLQWQHSNLFKTAGTIFMKNWIQPMTGGEEPSKEENDFNKNALIKSLDQLETIWLKDTKFLTGNDITFADLMMVSNLEQVIGLKLFAIDSQKHPKVENLLEETRQYFGESFKEAHKFVYKFAVKKE